MTLDPPLGPLNTGLGSTWEQALEVCWGSVMKEDVGTSTFMFGSGSEEVTIAIVGSMVVVGGGKVTAFERVFISVMAMAVVTVALIDVVVRAEA